MDQTIMPEFADLIVVLCLHGAWVWITFLVGAVIVRFARQIRNSIGL